MTENPLPQSTCERLLGRWTSQTWFKILAVALFVIAATVVTCVPAYRLDLDIYRIGGKVWLDGGDLYGKLPPTRFGLDMPFTYPPVAAIILSVLNIVPLIPATIVFNLVCLGALIAITTITVTKMSTLPRRGVLWAGLALGSFIAFLGPELRGFSLGQINIVLMALVFLDLFVVPKKYRGLLTGLAVSLKLTPAVFGLYLLVKRDWRAIIMMGVSTVVFTGLGFVFAWRDSVNYWTSVVWDASRIGGQAYSGNQSITGELFRLGIMDSTGRGKIVWIILVVLLLAYTIPLVMRLVRDHHDVLAVVVVNIFGLMASPVSWDHHWVWIPLALIVLAFHIRSRQPGTGMDRPSRVLGVLAISGFLCFAVAPAMIPIPSTNNQELTWPWYIHIVGNLFIIWAIAFLIACWRLSPKVKTVADEFC